MQIACPQCATRYELDERLLPPTGAPVQCTRCSHVFTAVPPIEEEGGARPTQPAGAVSEGTLVYGKRPALTPAHGIPTSTQVYGGAPDGTLVYGRRPALTPAQGIPTSTQVYGGPTGPERQDPRSTQTGGALDASQERSDPRSTQMFGAVDATAPAPQQKSDPRSTQMFGAVDAKAAAPQQRFDPRSTQLFGAVDATARESQPEPRSTQMFGALELPESPDLRITQSSAGLEPAEVGESGPALGGRRRTVSGASVLNPFEPPGLHAMDPEEELSEFDPAQALEASMRRRRNLVLLALGLLVLGIAGFAGVRWWSTREVPVPAEAVDAQSKAFNLLRRDDPKSLDGAVTQLDGLLKSWPKMVEARALHLVALLFQLDDVRMEIARLNAESEAINREISKLQDRKSPSDWQNRVNALKAQRKELNKRSDPLTDRASALEARVNQSFRALDSNPANLSLEQQLAVARATALYEGVKGSDQAIVLSERYRQLGGADGWAELAYAEYALNAPLVPPDTRKQAEAGLEALRSRDASFIRPWVLSGRLMLANKEPDQAVTAFEGATALNPGHTVASDLLKAAQRARTEAAEDN